MALMIFCLGIYPTYTNPRYYSVIEQKIQDDITISLKTQKIIVHDTVRVNVGITAQVDPTNSEGDFRNEIQSTLKKFVDTDWKIQSIQRSKGTRYENVHVQATARVPESENHQLQERATSLSRIGFELVNPSVDYSLTFDEIQAVNEELRITLFKNALVECASYNEALKEAKHKVDSLSRGTSLVQYRISSSRFDLGDNYGASNSTQPMHLQAMMATVSHMGAGVNAGYQDDEFADDDTDAAMDLNVSTRFSMTGTFVLRYLHV